MKTNLPITNKNIPLDAKTRMVSTTNLGGQITYANKDFCDVSGFSFDELEMQPHNIIRHPDMPQAAFKMAWDRIKDGRCWMGLVKNRCKNGDHYWVDAFIAPITEKGQTVGYQSVRRKPATEHVQHAEHLYQKLSKGKGLSLLPVFGLQWKIIALVIGCTLAFFLPLIFTETGLLRHILSATLSMTVGVAGALMIAAPWKRAALKAKNIIDDEVAQKTYTNRRDELGQIQLSQQLLDSKLQTVIWRLNDSAQNLESVSNETSNIASKTADDMFRQKAEVEQIASAITQMSATVNEVAHNASEAAQATDNARQQVMQGKAVVEQGIRTTRHLSSQVKEAAGVIMSLADVTNKIGGAAEMIRSIAEQTNLLALNAAIEAARAGEQGRGFAVVADEVRSLASKTQSSTDEIQGMIQNLQTATENAVKVMNEGTEIAEENVQQSALMAESLSAIDEAVNQSSNMVMQIATAAEEQGAVAEEVNRNICNINELSDQTQRSTIDSHEAIDSLTKQIHNLKNIVNQFTN